MVVIAGFVVLFAPDWASANAPTWTYGTFEGAAVSGEAQRVVRVNVRIESGLALEPDAVAATVSEILNDDRGWKASEDATFRVVADVEPDLLSPLLHRRRRTSCASPSTRSASCRAGAIAKSF